MIKYAVRYIDPIQASFTVATSTAIVCLLTFTLTGLAEYLEGRDVALLKSIPMRVFYYALYGSLTAFTTALAYNIASYYTGGVTITLREKQGMFKRPIDDDQRAVIGPPNA